MLDDARDLVLGLLEAVREFLLFPHFGLKDLLGESVPNCLELLLFPLGLLFGNDWDFPDVFSLILNEPLWEVLWIILVVMPVIGAVQDLLPVLLSKEFLSDRDYLCNLIIV